MASEAKRIIWTNFDLDFDERKDELRKKHPGVPDDQLVDLMFADNFRQYERVKMHLMRFTDMPIMVARKRENRKETVYDTFDIPLGRIADCMEVPDHVNIHHCYVSWYINRYGDLCCDMSARDEKIHMVYRVCKPDLTKRKRATLDAHIGSGNFSTLNKYTRRMYEFIQDLYPYENVRELVTKEQREKYMEKPESVKNQFGKHAKKHMR